MFTMDDLFEIAIKMEKNGAAVYIDAIEKIKGVELKSMLTWMADEEASHGKWFADQKNKLSLDSKEVNLKKMVPQVLQDMMGEKTLSLGEVNFSKITTVRQLLDTFIGFENDTIMFYELLEMFIEKKMIQDGLQTIILEEKKHIETLQAMKESIPGDPVLS